MSHSYCPWVKGHKHIEGNEAKRAAIVGVVSLEVVRIELEQPGFILSRFSFCAGEASSLTCTRVMNLKKKKKKKASS